MNAISNDDGQHANLSKDGGSPADNSRPTYVTSRPRYFSGEFLATQDFVDEQDYHVDRQVRHEAMLHASGILEGLDLTQAGDLTLNVGAGSAIDADGNQILVGRQTQLSLPSDSADGDYFVDVLFVETKSDPQSGSQGDTRFTQLPQEMLAIGPAFRQGAVPLGRLRVTNGAIDGVDTDYFSDNEPASKYAGLRFPGPSGKVGTLRLRNTQDAPNGYPGDPGYNSPNYQVVFDQNLMLGKNADGNGTSLEIYNGALCFYNAGDIWASDYTQRIRLRNHNVELLAGEKIALTTNNNDGTGSQGPIDALVAYRSGAVGIGSGDDEPKARLEVRGAIPDPQNLHASDPVALNLQVSDSEGQALLMVANDGATTTTGEFRASGGMTVANTRIGSDGRMAIGKASGAASSPLEIYGANSNLLLEVSDGDGINAASALNANGGITVAGSTDLNFGNQVRQMVNLYDGSYGIGVQTNTAYFRSGKGFAFYRGGAHSNDEQDPGQAGAHVLAINGDGNVIVPNRLKVGGGEDMNSAGELLAVKGSSGSSLLGVTDSGVTASVVLNANAGIAVSNTKIDASGKVAIGKTSGTPSNPLEVYDSSNNNLLMSVAPSGATLSGIMTASQYTFPNSATAGDAPPTITGRRVPVDQGNIENAERSELILFAGNDYRSDNGPDAVTLRAAALRFQTYGTENVADIDNKAGCNDRIYVDPNGKVSFGKSYYPNNANKWLEVWNPGRVGEGDKAMLEVDSDKVSANAPINANAGMTLSGSSSLFGKMDSTYTYNKTYTAETDGFVVAVIICTEGKRQGNITGTTGGSLICGASAHRDIGSSNKTLVDYGSFTMPVRKGDTWSVNYTRDSSLSGNTDTDWADGVTVTWIPFGS